LRHALKRAIRAIAALLVLPAAAVCWIEGWIDRRSEWVFSTCTHVLAMAPGPAGVWLRCAFYRMTLDDCAADWWMGFGSVFTHRNARVEQGVYIGQYAVIGSANLYARSLIGSRVSILSGGVAHELGGDGSWTAFDLSRTQPLEIGPDVWIGEGAIISANVGSGSHVACGAVVGSTVPSGVMFAGNPARFVRIISRAEQTPSAGAPA
jgi:acetyltransferase-like isoleucine patch superfamily enzyme